MSHLVMVASGGPATLVEEQARAGDRVGRPPVALVRQHRSLVLVPRLLQPHADRVDPARLADAGVATVRALDDVVTGGADVLREAWRTVATPEVTARCEVASADLRAGGGASRAADLVEVELASS